MKQLISTGQCTSRLADSNETIFFFELIAINNTTSFYRLYEDKERQNLFYELSVSNYRKLFKTQTFHPFTGAIQNELNESIQKQFNYSIIEKYQGKKNSSGLSYSDSDTLSHAREWVNKNISDGEGIVCPCCNQYAKQYRRKLTKSMAFGLSLIHKSGNRNFLHINEFFKNQDCPSSTFGDVAKLRFWGLIEKLEIERPDGSNRSGFYRITQDGIDFVNGKLKVPPYLIIRNDVPIEFSKELPIGFLESTLSAFNYRDLMDNL